MAAEHEREQTGPIEGRWEREDVASGAGGYTRTTVHVDRACLPHVGRRGQEPRCSASRGGDFYTVCSLCLTCDVPHMAAPGLMAYVEHPDGDCHCVFTRQPRTPGEIEKAIDAMCASELCGIRYGGSDPTILRRIRQHGPLAPEATDVLVRHARLARRKRQRVLVLVLRVVILAAALLLAFGGAD